MSIKNKTGHLFAFIAIFIWSTTYVATKTLLIKYTPTDILIIRFVVAFIFLFVLYPRLRSPESIKDELIFFALGLTGVMLYFWLENMSLTYTYASNVGMIVSTIPLLTALISHFIFKDEVFEKKILFGFFFAMIGVFIVIFNGKMIMKLNPFGDFLALLAACVWAIFSNLLKLVNDKYHPILAIRKTFFYGIISMTPIVLLSESNLSMEVIRQPKEIVCFAYLAFFASSLCFVLWNSAIQNIGSVKTTHYIYFVPLITMISSMLFLDEKINILMIIGGGLILIGVYISGRKSIDLTEEEFSTG